MKSACAGLALTSLLAYASDVSACGSCRGPQGPGAALTAPWQHWGIALAQSVRIGHGAFDERGRYHSFDGKNRDHVDEVVLGAALRPIGPLEIAATTAAGAVAVSGPGYGSSATSFGDSTLRARFDVASEPMAWQEAPLLPSLAFAATVRAPTGVVAPASARGASGGFGTVGSSATSQGLGTWEGALSVDARKTFADGYQVGLAIEGGYRLPDDSLGLRRSLAPRIVARAIGLRFIDDAWTAGVFVDFAVEGDVRYEERRAHDSAQRATSVGATLGWKHDNGLRSSLSLFGQLPFTELGKNSVTTVGLALSLAYTK